VSGQALDELLEKAESEPPFSAEEYASRLAKMRGAMTDAGIDLVYLSAPESICYLSGHERQWYQGQAPMEWHPGSGIAVSANSDTYMHFEDEDEAVLAKLTSVTTNFRIRRHGPSVLPWIDFVLSELAAVGWLKGTVGLEMWSSRPNRGYGERFQQALESRGCRVVDVTKLTRGVRRLKSEAELSEIRAAERIAEEGMQAAREHLRAGVTELDVYGEVVVAMARVGGETPGVPALVASGPRAACVHVRPSRRVIEHGDIVNLDICGVSHRYHASLARCFSIGEPTPEVSDVVSKMAGVIDVLADGLRPGLPVREFLRTAEDYYRQAGLWDERWWTGGYELGIAFPPDTVGEFSYEVGEDPGDETFEAGLACNFEGNFYLPGGAGVAVQTTTMLFELEQARFVFDASPRLTIID
jgi:Xaa-Pro aminopeptidase